MDIDTDRWYFSRGFLFFASAPLAGLAIMVANCAVAGQMRVLFNLDWRAWLGTWSPFFAIGILAAAASKRGTTIGWYTRVGGFAPLLAPFLIGYLGQQRVGNDWIRTAEVLVAGMLACGALPFSVVGALIGTRVGIARSQRED